MISLCAAVCFTTAVIFFVFGFLAGVEVVKADVRDVLRSLDNKQSCDRISVGAFRTLLRSIL